MQDPFRIRWLRDIVTTNPTDIHAKLLQDVQPDTQPAKKHSKPDKPQENRHATRKKESQKPAEKYRKILENR